RGRVLGQVTLEEADAADVHAVRGVRARAAQDELRGAAAQVHDQLRCGGVRHTGGRAQERQARLLLPVDDLRLQTQPCADPVDEGVPVRHVAAGRGRDEALLLRRVLRDDLRVLVADGEGPFERVRVEGAGPVDALPQPDDPHPAVDLRHRAVLIDVRDEESQGVRSAVEGRRSRHTWKPTAGGTSLIIASARSPTGFTPGPAARLWPTRAWRHLMRVGMPPAEKSSISVTSARPACAPIAARSARYARWAEA